MGIMDRLPPGVPPEMCGNMVPQKAKATVKEEMEYRPMLEKLADWARKNPGSAGTPDGLQKGGPGDSDCISVFLASILYAAKQRVRLVIAIGQPKAQGVFVEVFHPTFGGPEGEWIAVIPHAPFIFETAAILKSRRVMEQEL